MSNVQEARRAGQEAARVRALASARARVLRMTETERRALAHEFFERYGRLSAALAAAERAAKGGAR